jgi:hypothetical protein
VTASPIGLPPSAAGLPGRLAQLKLWLMRPRTRTLVFLVGVLLVLPSITNYLVTDDHLQAVRHMPGSPIAEIPHSYFDLYTFGRPGEVNEHFMDRGILLPWWTDPEYLVAFFRPLSALTHDLDGFLWPRSPAMAHAQTLAWYIALLVIVWRVYLYFVEPGWAASLALLLYAFDDTHGDTLSWIANRHAIITALIGLWVLLAHHRWRSEESAPWRAWMGPAGLAVGFLAGEGAILTCAYLASYALFLDAAPRRSRAFSLLPYAAVVVVWRILYQRYGYGAFASDGYLDVSREPAAFLARLPAAMAVLLQSQFSFIPADSWMWSPARLAAWVLDCAIVLVGMLAVVVVPVVRNDRRARFWCSSLLGALVPVSGGIPTDRSLVFPSVAALALLSLLFARFVERIASPIPAPGGALRSAGRFAIALIIGGLFVRKMVLAPIVLPVRANGVLWARGLNELAEQAVPDVPDVDGRTIIIANPPLMDFASYLLLVRATRGEVVPRRVRWLTTGQLGLTLTRTSDRSIVVEPDQGFFEDRVAEIFRAARRTMKLGDTVLLRDMTVTITRVMASGKAAAAQFVFPEPLESPSYLWRVYTERGCESLHLPRVGETITLPGINLDKLLWNSYRASPMFYSR